MRRCGTRWRGSPASLNRSAAAEQEQQAGAEQERGGAFHLDPQSVLNSRMDTLLDGSFSRFFEFDPSQRDGHSVLQFVELGGFIGGQMI